MLLLLLDVQINFIATLDALASSPRPCRLPFGEVLRLANLLSFEILTRACEQPRFGTVLLLLGHTFTAVETETRDKTIFHLKVVNTVLQGRLLHRLALLLCRLIIPRVIRV